MKNFGAAHCTEVPGIDGPDWPDNPERTLAGGSICLNDLLSTWGPDGAEGGSGDIASTVQMSRPASLVMFADSAAVSVNGNAWDGAAAGRTAYLANLDDKSKYTNTAIGRQFYNPFRLSWNGGGDPMNVPVPRHSGFCNVIFFDGHAKAIKLSQYYLSNRADWGTDKDIFGERGVRGQTYQ